MAGRPRPRASESSESSGAAAARIRAAAVSGEEVMQGARGFGRTDARARRSGMDGEDGERAHDGHEGEGEALKLWQRKLAEALERRLDGEVAFANQPAEERNEEATEGVSLFPNGPRVCDVPTQPRGNAERQVALDTMHGDEDGRQTKARKRRCKSVAVSGEDVLAHAERELERASKRAAAQWAAAPKGPPYPLLDDPARAAFTDDMLVRATRLTTPGL